MCVQGITEVFGEFRTGKTQYVGPRESVWSVHALSHTARCCRLCHTLCVTAQLPSEQKGGNGKVRNASRSAFIEAMIEFCLC